MEAKRGQTRWTYSEFARLPSEGGTRYEVIDGELVVTPAPGLRHQRIATDLVTALNAFVRDHGLGQVFAGPVDVLFAEGDYLQPDIVFVRTGNEHLLSERGIEGPPDLVVEILSPSTAARDRGVKLERYRYFGVPEYWVVDPDARALEVRDLASGASEPRVVGPDDTLHWAPAGAEARLALRVAALMPEA
jgi:Uma2 family endonuclease